MVIAQLVAFTALTMTACDVSAAAVKTRTGNHATSHGQPRKGLVPFRVDSWASVDSQIKDKASSGGRLDLGIAKAEVEEIVVFAKRLRRDEQEPADSDTLVSAGAVTVTGTTLSEQAAFSGVTVTAAIPVGGVPGLDAVLNVSSGYDAINPSTTVSSAAATAGLRLKF